MKVLFVTLDGLGDRPAPELDRKTPLEAAHTPNLNKLASCGITGLLNSFSPGIAPGSDAAHFVLFGYSLDEFPGRGVFEAVGEGLDLNFEEVVLRASFASVAEENGCLKIVSRGIGAEEEVCRQLAKDILDDEIEGVNIRFVYNSKRQGIIFLSGGVSPDITDSDPFCNDLPVIKIQLMLDIKNKKKAEVTAHALNTYLRKVYFKLKDHPINIGRIKRGLPPLNFLLTKWASGRKRLTSFSDKFGFKAAMVASSVLFKGMASEIGMDFIELLYLEDVHKDMKRRLKAASDALNGGYDFVHVHTKVPDEAAHTKNPLFKKEVIEKLDTAFDTILSDFDDDTLIVVTSDHSTPSSGSLIHSGEPVPIVIIGRTVRVDDIKEFGERACLRGGLGRIEGRNLMNIILNLTDRAKYFGSRPVPLDTSHRPSKINPFKI
ncbi:alkaline phosphatase family protein [Candidatus Oleimmundimicrobium sp.]|uniref:alkaline phosphatase family protein n=1 Tax=Candidatus Oleimmundimicrobium sp. TaxID=3060597 RepID=UPI002721F03C|nr:alkaline phosphatase family protein [Candidatus Oleimmundimicrobium sp.]MDO8886446.1 alkaline phosphatase family protein [Candidatus Oleimmundimicrobium sp.]